MRIISILSILILSVLSLTGTASAQFADETLIPEGARGRLSEEQAQVFALRRMPGVVLRASAWRDNQRYYHEYTIERPDGSIYEVAINALNGEVFSIEVDILGADFRAPPGVIDREYAENVGLSYAAERGKGAFKGKVESSALMTYERALVYGIKIEKGVRDYLVFVDAFKAEALGMEEVE